MENDYHPTRDLNEELDPDTRWELKQEVQTGYGDQAPPDSPFIVEADTPEPRGHKIIIEHADGSQHTIINISGPKRK